MTEDSAIRYDRLLSGTSPLKTSKIKMLPNGRDLRRAATRRRKKEAKKQRGDNGD